MGLSLKQGRGNRGMGMGMGTRMGTGMGMGTGIGTGMGTEVETEVGTQTGMAIKKTSFKKRISCEKQLSREMSF